MGKKKQVIELDSVFENKQTALFFAEWLKNGQNATKAYLSLHSHVSYESATVLGSRQLGKVSISDLLAMKDLGLNTYLTQLKDGLEAMSYVGKKSVPDHKTRRLYHEVLGKLLKIENKDNTQIQNHQFNFQEIREGIARSRRERGLSE